VTRLERFLTATDLDDLLRRRHEISALAPEESARVVSVVRDWNDVQAVANLIFHADLIPTDVRFDALDRALHSKEVPYLTLAATVGLDGVALDEVPGEKRAAWTQLLLGFVRSKSPVLAGRASVTLFGWSQSIVIFDILPQLLSLYPVPDDSACRNIVAAVLHRCGDLSPSEFDERLLEWQASDSARTALHRAHAEYAERKEHDALRAMIMKAPVLAYIPNLSEGFDIARSPDGESVEPTGRKAWWRFW